MPAFLYNFMVSVPRGSGTCLFSYFNNNKDTNLFEFERFLTQPLPQLSDLFMWTYRVVLYVKSLQDRLINRLLMSQRDGNFEQINSLWNMLK